MDTILLVDVDPARADLISDLLRANHIPVKRCSSVSETIATIESKEQPAVIVVHCALVNHAFTELAGIRHHPKVKMLFYCTDAGERFAGVVPQLPQELTEIILKITESKRLLKAS